MQHDRVSLGRGFRLGVDVTSVNLTDKRIKINLVIASERICRQNRAIVGAEINEYYIRLLTGIESCVIVQLYAPVNVGTDRAASCRKYAAAGP